MGDCLFESCVLDGYRDGVFSTIEIESSATVNGSLIVREGAMAVSGGNISDPALPGIGERGEIKTLTIRETFFPIQDQ